MTKKNTKRNRIILIALLITGVALAIWYVTRPKAAAPKVASTTTVTKTTTDDPNKSDPTLDKKTDAGTTTTTTTNQNLSIMVSRPVNNDTVPLNETLEIRSTVSGATSGTCSLTATGPGGKTVTKSASVKPQSSYGSCSFDIASSELVAGDWQLAITVTSGSATGKTNLKVTVQ